MEQKIQELEEQIKIIEETLDEIKQVLNTIAERETEVTNEAKYKKMYNKYSKGEPEINLQFWRILC